MAIAFATGLHEKISLQVLQDNKENLLQAISDRPVMTALGFIGAYIVFVALSSPVDCSTNNLANLSGFCV